MRLALNHKLLTAKRSSPTGGSAYGMAKNDSYSSIWKPGVARPSMHPSDVQTIGNTLVKLSSFNGGDGNVTALPNEEIGVFDDEITVGLDALKNFINRKPIKHWTRCWSILPQFLYSYGSNEFDSVRI